MPPQTILISNVGVIRRWEGTVTGGDQVTSAHQFENVLDLEHVRYVIVDYRKVTTFAVSTDEVRQLADFIRNREYVDRLVLVVPSDLMYGLARMWDMTVGDRRTWTSHVVRTWEDAINWLESELPDIDFSEARQLG